MPRYRLPGLCHCSTRSTSFLHLQPCPRELGQTPTSCLWNKSGVCKISTKLVCKIHCCIYSILLYVHFLTGFLVFYCYFCCSCCFFLPLTPWQHQVSNNDNPWSLLKRCYTCSVGKNQLCWKHSWMDLKEGMDDLQVYVWSHVFLSIPSRCSVASRPLSWQGWWSHFILTILIHCSQIGHHFHYKCL